MSRYYKTKKITFFIQIVCKAEKMHTQKKEIQIVEIQS